MKRALPLAIPPAALLALLALGLPVAGRADWLITTEGGRVETRGPWEAKGKLVVFTTADGNLSSLRATQVDLPASQRATAESKQALAEADSAPPPEPRKSVRSITDKDFSHPDVAPAAPDAKSDAKDAKKDGKSDAKAGDAGTTGGKPGSGKSPVAVGTWQKTDRTEKDGIDVIGSLDNPSGDLQTDVGMTVTLLDDAGSILGTVRAVLDADSITAKGSTHFKAGFPGIFTFARAKFDIQSAGLKLTLGSGAPPPGTAKDSGAASPPPSH